MTGRYRCGVRDCENRSTHVEMVRIPKNLKIRKQWAPLVGVAYYEIPVYGKVCAIHFKEEDFIRATKKTPFGTAQIKPGVLPSLNLPGPTAVDDDYSEVLLYARSVLGDTGFGQDSGDLSVELKNLSEDKDYLRSVLMILKDAEAKIEKVKKLRDNYRKRGLADDDHPAAQVKRVYSKKVKRKQEPDMKSYVQNVVKPREVAIKEGLIDIVDTTSESEGGGDGDGDEDYVVSSESADDDDDDDDGGVETSPGPSSSKAAFRNVPTTSNRKAAATAVAPVAASSRRKKGTKKLSA